jgi:hypothetical protein
MKAVFVGLFSLFMATHVFAATASCSSPSVLGFTACDIPASDSDGTDFLISDESDAGLSFVFEKRVGQKNLYKEMSGKCEISVEQFSKNFAEPKAKDAFMLSLSATIVKVTKGSGCVLKQSGSHDLRSVTGVYVY